MEPQQYGEKTVIWPENSHTGGYNWFEPDYREYLGEKPKEPEKPRQKDGIEEKLI